MDPKDIAKMCKLKNQLIQQRCRQRYLYFKLLDAPKALEDFADAGSRQEQVRQPFVVKLDGQA